LGVHLGKFAAQFMPRRAQRFSDQDGLLLVLRAWLTGARIEEHHIIAFITVVLAEIAMASVEPWPIR
jgi:hypothetical protein